MTHKINVDLGDLEIALDNNHPDVSNYLDTETGEVIMVMRELEQRLEEIYDAIYDEEGTRTVTLEAYLETQDDPEWQKPLLLDADRVMEDEGGRYILIRPDDPHAGYRDMEAFIETVEDDRVRPWLWRAIQGRGAFRRFKDALLDYPDLRERWFAFRDARAAQRMTDWLEARGIEIEN
jgi:hypothetical protein